MGRTVFCPILLRVLGGQMTNPFKSGDKVQFTEDFDTHVYVVYAVYSDSKVSLGLGEYPDIEGDHQVDIRELERAYEA